MTPTDAASPRRVQWLAGAACLLASSLTIAQSPVRAAMAQPPPAVVKQEAAATGSAAPRTVLVVGDSLSAAYGLDAAQGWVALTAQRIARAKPGWRVVNASISGDTSAGGATRIVQEVVRHRPSVVVIELGANDGLRGLPLRETRRNLARMIGASKGIGAEVLLVGMRLPPNYGPAYTREFEQGFGELARRFDAAYLPFLLAPIVRERDAFQPDNMHPTASVQPLLRDHVWAVLAPMLE